MITVITCIVLYLLAMVAFCFWDSLVGFPANFDGQDNPPAAVIAAFWPIAIPILACMSLSIYLDRLKSNREEKENQLNKIRIAAQKEQAIYLEQVELELKETIIDERKSKNKR